MKSDCIIFRLYNTNKNTLEYLSVWENLKIESFNPKLSIRKIN